MSKPFFGECIDAIHAGRYEVQWHHAWRAVTKNKNGTIGFATILQSSSEARPIGGVCRIHLCAHNPCMARWPDSKYGIVGPPMHLQPVFPAVAQSSAPPAVAESSAPCAVAESSAPPAVAEFSAPLAPLCVPHGTKAETDEGGSGRLVPCAEGPRTSILEKAFHCVNLHSSGACSWGCFKTCPRRWRLSLHC